MTIPLESATFEQKMEVQERHIEEYSEFDAFLRRTKELRKAMKFAKKRKPLALGKRISSMIYYLRLCLKILLVGVIIDVLIFLIVKAVPVAQWIIGFLSSIYDFFVEAIEWVVDLLVSIYDWIVKAIEGIILNIKKVVDFVDDFPNIIGFFLMIYGMICYG
jgi:hypothetical protein